jgi:prepilin-type N-terminal cleavage/methylation domain-containing protein
MRSGGFTLVEMLVAVSLFLVVVTISIGAILSVFDANKKAQASKTIADNLNLSIENMARIVRFGNSYYCGVSSGLTSTSNCSNGGNAISVTFDGNRIVYSWNGTTGGPIQRSDNGGTPVNITSPETKIEYLRFYVFGSSNLDTEQPYIIAIIKGYSGSKPTTQTKFSIETLISQRKLDLNQ